jgi:hypothetical protein
VVKHATHNPKVEGLNPGAGTGREKVAKGRQSFKNMKIYNFGIQAYHIFYIYVVSNVCRKLFKKCFLN